METQTSMQPKNHSAHFIQFIDQLVEKFNPLQIYNFSNSSFLQNEQGCFKKEALTHYSNYCLLIITDSDTRIDHNVQDFANTHYQNGTITIICYSKRAMENEINANNRFFITVYKNSEVLFKHTGLKSTDLGATFDPINSLTEARKHYKHRFQLSEGFFIGAGDCLSNWEQCSICAFMLHQAIEQLCIGLIRIHMDYRSEFHNLKRLLHLCTCFSAKPLLHFTQKPEDRRLFDILCNSYSCARYDPDFVVSEEDAKDLSNMVYNFSLLASKLCKEKINELKKATVISVA